MDVTLLILLAIGTAFTFFWLLRFRERLRLKWPAALAIAVLHTVIGVFTVKVFAVIEGFGNPEAIGNLSLFGGVFFMPIAYFVGAKVTKRRLADVFDVFSIAMIFTVMCARVNCIITGCCQGAYIPGTDGLQWPTRELEILFYIVLLVILGRKVLAGQMSGEAYPIYMISYGAFRFVIETFRQSSVYWGIFHLSHVWALVALGIGLSIYFEMKAHKEKKGKVRR